MEVVPSHVPILISSTKKWPASDPEPKVILAFYSVFFEVEDAWLSYAYSFGPSISVALFKIHVFVEPVSNKALIFYGGLPTKISLM